MDHLDNEDFPFVLEARPLHDSNPMSPPRLPLMIMKLKA